MSLSLLINSDIGESYEMPCGALMTIGRVAPNDITFPSDLKVSRHHALIRLMGDGKYYLIDLGSSNGTTVNDRRIMVPYELKDSDTIEIGDSTIVFRSKTETKTEMSDNSGSQATVLTVGAAVHRMTILVIDIRNFTALNEKLPHDLLAKVMGHFFRDSTSTVESNGGVVDKFIGDAIMARWLVDTSGVKGSVKGALSAALGLWRLVQNLNSEYPELSNSLKIGAGVNSGQAVLGNVGAGGTREYTALGDSVNIAFRLETASKELGKDLVLGQTSYGTLPMELWQKSLQTVSVKNKKEPLTVWAISFEELDSLITRI